VPRDAQRGRAGRAAEQQRRIRGAPGRQPQLAALLGDSFWGDRAPAVDGAVQQYLTAQMWRQRSAVPAAAAAPGGANSDPADVACQACNSAAVRPRCCCAIAATGGSTCSALACAGSSPCTRHGRRAPRKRRRQAPAAAARA
jgi:hypothetical protein